MFASFLSREKTHPTLLITSALGTPEWISTLEAQKLAVGTCNFTCCQRNHKFGNKIVPCDRGITRGILETLAHSKVKNFYKLDDIRRARLYSCNSQWWLRGDSSHETKSSSLSELKHDLEWTNDDDEERSDKSVWIDCVGLSVLVYAVMANNHNAVIQLVGKYTGTQLSSLLAWKFGRDGVVEIGIPGESTALHLAMLLSSPDIVLALLQAGADPNDTDVMGNDSLMLACTFGRLRNIQVWCSNVSNWDVDRRNERFGSTALHLAVYLGPKKLKTVQYLIEKQGANAHVQNKSGSSALILACGNEDCDPKVVRYLVEEAGVDLNRQINSKSTMWKLMRATARFAVNSRMTRSKFLRRVAESSGLTALHYAARRGDMEIVELLMEYGAKPSTRNDLGRDVLS